MSGSEIVESLRANYFSAQGFEVRSGTEDGTGYAWILVLLKGSDVPKRLFGLRFIEYPSLPPTLRFWKMQRWSEDGFEFDFTTTGDAGCGKTEHDGVATMCIPFHTEYYRNNWHTDRPWIREEAENQVGELVGNILSRA